MINYSLFILLIGTCTLFYDAVGRSVCENISNDFFGAQIILSFASWKIGDEKKYIGIYYYNRGYKSGDAIGIHVNYTARHQQSTNYYYPTSKSGFITTNIDISQLTYNTKSIYQQQCLGYGASWMRNGTIKTTSCLSTHPDWMYQRKEMLKYATLSSIIIPGTHNSGSYLKRSPQSLIEKFTATQDGSIFDQLIMGVRYFDLRPGKDNDAYWIYHGNYLMTPLNQTIDDVKKFIKNTQEIVILHFKEFPHGFETVEDHNTFIRYLKKSFGNYLLPHTKFDWSVNLGTMWRLNKRLIITYDRVSFKNIIEMWPPIPQNWGNVQSLDGLRSYLTSVETQLTRPRASMAQFTMDTLTVTSYAVADAFGMDHLTLVQAGSIVGPPVTQWYNELFYKNASIIAVDYLNATGIVEVAIEWNDRQYSQCYKNYVKLMT